MLLQVKMGACSYIEEELDHKPDSEEIRSIVSQWYNSETDKKILSGLEYEGHTVWLSNENQFNYKAAYDIAVQTSGQNLPVTFKLGTDEDHIIKHLRILKVYRIFT